MLKLRQNKIQGRKLLFFVASCTVETWCYLYLCSHLFHGMILQAFENMDTYDKGIPLTRRIMEDAAALGHNKLKSALAMRKKRNKIVPEEPAY